MVSNNGRKQTHPSVDKVPTKTTRPLPRPDYIFDVRMVTKDSDPTTRDEADNPTYWHQPLTPISFANPKPPTLTSAQIVLWRHTVLHWYAHIHLAFTTEDITDLETRPPPALRRTIPNIDCMEGNSHSPADHPIPLEPIRQERTRLGHLLYRRPSTTPTHTLPVPTTAPATNSQQQFTVPQSIRPRPSAVPHQSPARAHVNGPRRVQLIEPILKAHFGQRNTPRTSSGNRLGDAPTQLLSHNPCNPHNRSILPPQPADKRHRKAPATSPPSEEQSYKRRQTTNSEHGNYKPHRPASTTRQDSYPDPPGEPWSGATAARRHYPTMTTQNGPHAQQHTLTSDTAPPHPTNSLHRDYTATSTATTYASTALTDSTNAPSESPTRSRKHI